VLGWERADMIARAAEGVPRASAALFAAAIEQRALRRPLQHLTGHQAFWRHDFIVTPDVLIPRPETELLVETALELIRDREMPLIVDVGTGSGCIALSLAAERPDARVHATDLSAAALLVARGNASRLGLSSRVTFHEGDLLGPVQAQAGSIDLVVSNPPYVSAKEWAGLEPEVRDHDPRMALVPPEGVTALYARLLAAAYASLSPGGVTMVEVGVGQAESIAELARRAGLDMIRVRPDLQGVPRAVIARRPRIPLRGQGEGVDLERRARGRSRRQQGGSRHGHKERPRSSRRQGTPCVCGGRP
jgi:release factor glutamine methyltransferase